MSSWLKSDADQRLRELDDRFIAFRPRLVGICRRLAGDAAEDVVHDAYVLARRQVHTLRDPDAIEAWLTTISLRQCVSRHRRQRRFIDRLGELVPRRQRPRDVGLHELIEQLPVRERTVLILHHAYGYSLAEVAQLLGLSHTNARSIAARTRRRLLVAWEEADRG